MVGGSVKGARGGHTFEKPLARLRLIESYFKKILAHIPRARRPYRRLFPSAPRPGKLTTITRFDFTETLNLLSSVLPSWFPSCYSCTQISFFTTLALALALRSRSTLAGGKLIKFYKGRTALNLHLVLCTVTLPCFADFDTVSLQQSETPTARDLR